MADPSISTRDIQTAIAASKAQWQVGENQFTGLPRAQKRQWLGYSPGPREGSLDKREAKAARNLLAFQASLAASAQAASAHAAGHAPTFDARNYGGKNFVTDVKNQGGCGSCVAFGTLAVMEGTLRRQANNPELQVDYSEAQLFYCHARERGRMCNDGWWVPDAMNCVQTLGVVDEACYPYVAGDQACSGLCADATARTTKIAKWRPVLTHSAMKDWLTETGPLAACFTVYDDFYSYQSGIYTHVTGASLGGHCVCCVGYNDDDQCWICKNSWGTGWAEQGYFRIAYGQCGIDSTMYGIEGVTSSMWINNAQITGLWANNQDRNAYIFLDGTGWRKLQADTDSAFIAMLAQCVAAKSGGRPVNAYEDSGVITQVYVF